MGNYIVGEKYSGKVFEIIQNGILVELEDNVYGRIETEEGEIPVEVGQVIDVVVKQNSIEGIVLDFVSVSMPSNDIPSQAKNSWNNWIDIPKGNLQAMTAMTELRTHADAFLNELTNARKEWEDAKANSQQIYDTNTSDTRRIFEENRKRFISESENNIKATEQRRTTANNIVNACNYFISNMPSNATNPTEIARGRMTTVTRVNGNVQKAITTKIQAYRDLCNCLIAEAESQRNEKLDKARQEQIDRNTQAERRFEVKHKEICNSRREDINTGFNKTMIHEYQQGILSSRFNPNYYECPKEIPEYIMLGDIGLIIPNNSSDDMDVVQAIEMQAADLGSRGQGEYVVRIPYAQRLEDGISLLMRYLPSDRSYVQSLIQPLLLKLFMSFPAGKLEATMIDPLELGASFSDIPKLASGPNSARIIDTKIWSKEKDIENAISTLRQRLENMTQAYGGNSKARLKKEVIRALAITDFPVGFSETALKDLHAIVRNSASLGVCVFICSNDEELEKLKQKNGNLVNEICQNVFETKASGKRLMLVGNNKERLFIQIDEMADVMENKSAIISQISSVIDRTQLISVPFSEMYKDDIYDSNSWFTGNHDEIAIPIGVKGADNVVKMVLGRGGGSTEHHALIAGPTGAGKSTFLHTLIMSTLISYSPDEVQMYLLDFKEGVEFNVYTQYKLPSLRVVAINSEREFGLSVLEELCTELETRTKIFSRYGVSGIESYNKLEGVEKIPKLLLIFDEVQELFRSDGENDSISSKCLSYLNKLVMQGRAIGIHVILACQDFRNCSGLEKYFSQMAIRVAIKGSEEGASSILNSDNEGVRTLQNQPAGAAIYNGRGGVESANNFFQISYLSNEEKEKLLNCLNSYFSDPDEAQRHENKKTRIMLTNAEDNVHNCFNRLIFEGPESIEQLSSTEDSYALLLGQSFGKKNTFMPEMRKRRQDNLLVVSKDEKMALSLFELSAMSILYEELHTNADKSNALIYVIDLFDSDLADEECDFDFLEKNFNKQVIVAKLEDAQNMIDDIYNIVIERAEGTKPSSERIFLMFFGINRARNLQTGRIYDDLNSDDLSALDKLRKIIIRGPEYGVNSIVWGESLRSIENMLGDHYDSMFNKRIAYKLDEESMEFFVSEIETKSLRGKTAVYYDIAKDIRNTHFRPYEVPTKEWIERYAAAYKNAINEGDM